jgi:hypothetical protein
VLAGDTDCEATPAIAITLDTYSHVAEGLKGDAASLVAGIIAGTEVSPR